MVFLNSSTNLASSFVALVQHLGTFMLEFTALSLLMGDSTYENAARRAMDYIWSKRSRLSDLVGTVMNVRTGEWVRKESGIGAGIDSYYEYIYKAYVLLDDQNYLDRFNRHYSAIAKYIQQGPLLVNVNMLRPEQISRSYMDSLGAFWPAIQVMKGDLKSAIEVHELLYQVVREHKFLPEAFTSDFKIFWGHHPIRPEFVESTYFLFKATGDPHYLDVAEYMVEAIQNYTRVPCGFAALSNLKTGQKEDRFDSFVISETFKYLYLIFSEKEELWLDIDDFVFTTEAHLIPLSIRPGMKNATYISNKLSPPTAEAVRKRAVGDDTCFNYNLLNKPYWAGDIRRTLHGAVKSEKGMSDVPKDTCTPQPEQIPIKIVTTPKPPGVDFATPEDFEPISASNFDYNDETHAYTLSAMGIEIVFRAEGDVQLVHHPGKAFNAALNNEGLKFMADMIRLTTIQKSSKTVQIQVISHPYWGGLSLKAGNSVFGPDLAVSDLTAEVVPAFPIDACSIDEKYDISGYIVIAMRGGCMFAEKARAVQRRGGVGVLIVDNNEDSSIKTNELFSLSSDNNPEPVEIPAVFVFHKEGIGLLSLHLAHGLKVRLSTKLLDLNHFEDEIPPEIYVQYKTGKQNWLRPLENLYAFTENIYYEDDGLEENSKYSVYFPSVSEVDSSASRSPEQHKSGSESDSDSGAKSSPHMPAINVKEVDVSTNSAEDTPDKASAFSTVMKFVLKNVNSIRDSYDDMELLAVVFYQESPALGLRVTSISKHNVVETRTLTDIIGENHAVIASFKRQQWPRVRLDRMVNGVARLRGTISGDRVSDIGVDKKLTAPFLDEILESVVIDLKTGETFTVDLN